MVAAGLRRTVGTVGTVGSFFGKKPLGTQCTKNLVRRNVVEALALHGSGPGSAGSVEEVYRSDYVGFYKGHWVGNGTIYMAFCGQMHHPIGLVAVKEVLHGGGITNVNALKKIVFGIRQVGEVLEVARIG